MTGGVGARIPIMAILVSLMCLLSAPADEITVKAVEGLKFEPVRMAIEAEEKVQLKFVNADQNDLPHNLVIGTPGSLKKLVEEGMKMGAEGPVRGFVPDIPEVLHATKLLPAGEEQELSFNAPKEPGVYPYVCTFPGHGYVMYGALYVSVEMPAIEDDPNIPKLPSPPTGGEFTRPFVQRMFMPSSGPASIAVALPNGQNYCWDAGACRIRYAWPGDFIDAERHFTGNGSALAKIPTKRYWRALETGFPIRFISKDGEVKKSPVVKFKGYRLVAGRPRFNYSIGELEVSEFIEEMASGDGLRRHFSISEPPGAIEFRIASAKGRQLCSVGKEEGEWVRLSPEEAKNFTVTVLP